MDKGDRFWLGWRMAGIFLVASLPWMLLLAISEILNKRRITESQFTNLSWPLVGGCMLLGFVLAYSKKPILNRVRGKGTSKPSAVMPLVLVIFVLTHDSASSDIRLLSVCLALVATAASAVIMNTLFGRFIDSLPEDSPLVKKPETAPPPVLVEDGRLVIPSDLSEAAGIKIK